MFSMLSVSGRAGKTALEYRASSLKELKNNNEKENDI